MIDNKTLVEILKGEILDVSLIYNLNYGVAKVYDVNCEMDGSDILFGKYNDKYIKLNKNQKINYIQFDDNYDSIEIFTNDNLVYDISFDYRKNYNNVKDLFNKFEK